MKKLLLLLFLAVPVMAQAAHENDFTFTPSATAGVAGTRVYRSVSGANTFTVIATLAATATTYADTTVVAGNKFDYKLTAFCPAAGCSTGVAGESAFSNTVTLTTPSDVPNPPASLSGTAK